MGHFYHIIKKTTTPSVFKLLTLLIFRYVWPFVSFKILISIYKIISHISNFLSDKSNQIITKIYDFLKKISKTNDQT
jgi:hypothetical protein